MVGWPSHGFIQKLNAFKIILKEWNVNTFGKQDSAKQDLINVLNAIDAKEDLGPLDECTTKHRLSIKANLLTLPAREDSLWKQRCKLKWLIDGMKTLPFSTIIWLPTEEEILLWSFYLRQERA